MIPGIREKNSYIIHPSLVRDPSAGSDPHSKNNSVKKFKKNYVSYFFLFAAMHITRTASIPHTSTGAGPGE